MTFNLMVAKGNLYVSPRTRFSDICHDEKKTMTYELRWTQSLGCDIRWPGYIRVLVETSIHLIHLCHLIDLELLRTSSLLLFKLDP